MSSPPETLTVSRREFELVLDGLGAAIDAELVEGDEAVEAHERLSYALAGLKTRSRR